MNLNATNDRAVCVTNSWLTAVKISHRKSTMKGYDVEVTTKAGRTLYVAVQADESVPTPISPCVIVPAIQLASPNKLDALEAFYRITVAAGYGRPLPVDRGQDPDRKLNLDDEFELVAMRHREFRHAPNPDSNVLRHYDQVLNNVVRYYYNRPGNRALLQRCGYAEGDLKTFALVWTTNYIHKYTIAEPTHDDNEKLLTAHLKQRFNEFFPLLWKKASGWFPATDVLATGLYSSAGSRKSLLSAVVLDENGNHEHIHAAIYQPPAAKAADRPVPCFSHGGSTIYFNDPRIEDEEDPDYVARNNRLDKSSSVKRRKSAAALLSDGLLSMPHDKRVGTLIEAAENPSLCFDTRREAVRQIKKHRVDCVEPTCIVAAASAKVDEDVGGVDTGSGDE